MAWRRLGRIFVPDGTLEWARSHASLPVPVAIGGDRFRVFFSARDASQRSSVGWVDIILDQQPQIVAQAKQPALKFGTPGMFDDSGVSVGSIVREGRRHRLYYMGWNLGQLAPWRNSIGLAAGEVDEPAFERVYRGPIMDRSPEDPFTLSYPWVLRLADRDWRMWYGSHTQWGAAAADMHHVIKSARSSDGIKWERSETPALDASLPGEYALARPAVIREANVFRMWFACRGERYRIGYAESRDGAHWRRMDSECGLAPATHGWDSEMTCYPFPFRHRGRLYLAYNGDGYGLTGFGIAEWV